VWIGEILNRKEDVNQIFKFPIEKFELMGVVAIGMIDDAREKVRKESRERRSLDEFIEWF